MQLYARPNESMIIVRIDNMDYAVIDNVDCFSDIDVEKVANWVNETYYNNDHLCSAYVPCRLQFSEFRYDTHEEII